MNETSKALSDQQKAFFVANGYLDRMSPVFTPEEVSELNAGFDELQKLVRPKEDPREIRGWHESSRFLYDICMYPGILDRIETLIGPDFCLWDSHFYIKPARSNVNVGWHQDLHVKILDPEESLTVSLVFEDRSETNGAMRLVPGSHKNLEVAQRGEPSVLLGLRAGEVAFHDDRIVHSSAGNRSDGRRVGFNARYVATRVKGNLERLPELKTYLCRGTDRFRHNPPGRVPTEQYARPDRLK